MNVYFFIALMCSSAGMAPLHIGGWLVGLGNELLTGIMSLQCLPTFFSWIGAYLGHVLMVIVEHAGGQKNVSSGIAQSTVTLTLISMVQH